MWVDLGTNLKIEGGSFSAIDACWKNRAQTWLSMRFEFIVIDVYYLFRFLRIRKEHSRPIVEQNVRKEVDRCWGITCKFYIAFIIWTTDGRQEGTRNEAGDSGLHGKKGLLRSPRTLKNCLGLINQKGISNSCTPISSWQKPNRR